MENNENRNTTLHCDLCNSGHTLLPSEHKNVIAHDEVAENADVYVQMQWEAIPPEEQVALEGAGMKDDFFQALERIALGEEVAAEGGDGRQVGDWIVCNAALGEWRARVAAKGTECGCLNCQISFKGEVI